MSCRIREDSYEHTITNDCCSAELRKLGRGPTGGDALRRTLNRVYTVEHNRSADSDYDSGGWTKPADTKRAIDAANAAFSLDAANHVGTHESTERNYS